ncbi:MAG: hypothetical protein KKI08_22625 [Armatimonadetes bacterium]|nr:hypothetical protein [Armatimonadota bacterium]
MRTRTVVLVGLSLTAGLLLCGCSDSEGNLVLPAALVGTWGVGGFDANGNPKGAALVDVQPDGDVLFVNVGLQPFALAQAPAIIVGQVFNVEGNFQGDVNPNGMPVHIAGDLDEDDTGTGTWNSPTENGTLQLWRANNNQNFTLNCTVQGTQTGTGTITAGVTGILTGTMTIDGLGSDDIHGVVTGSGEVVGGWGGADSGLPFVTFQGNLTVTGATGTWTAEDGSTGTWTAVFA